MERIILRSMSIPPNIAPYQGILPRLGQGVYVHTTAQVIGDVTLGDDVSVWPGTVIRGDVNRIMIGTGSNVQDLSVLHVSHKSSWDPGGAPLIVSERVTIGHKVILHGCEIGDECLIGMGSIVMDGAVVEARVLVAAGSLVPAGKRLESGHLYVGRPVKQARPLTPEEIVHFAYSAAHYAKLAASYR